MLSAKCPNCGGTITFDKDHIATFCSFCGSHLPDMTDYVKKAAVLEIEQQHHAMEMETMKKQIKKERVHNSVGKIKSTAEIIKSITIIILVLCFVIPIMYLMIKIL